MRVNISVFLQIELKFQEILSITVKDQNYA